MSRPFGASGGDTASLAGPIPGRASQLDRARLWGAATVAGVATITVLRLLWLAVQPADLYPDEAQYWFWAQHLALGYYSKPPLVAWLIAATTWTFGDGESAVRLAAPLLHAAVSLLVYAIGARLYGRRVGFWSAVAYATLPGVSVSAFIISTDAALLPFWAAALYAFIRAREAGGLWWAAVGIAAGFGLLAKYAMAYWLLSAFGLVLLDRAERRHLRPLLGAVAIAVAIYLPNLWWNWVHGFVSYRHVGDNADLAGPLFHPSACLEFVASQFGVFGPVFFSALLALIVTREAFAEARARLLATFALPTLAMMVAVSLLSRAHPNWAAPTYVSATVLVVAWMQGRGWGRTLLVSVALNFALAAVVFGGRDALAAAGVEVPAKYDPLHRLRGWRSLGAEVGAVMAQHPGLTLLTDDRELTAALIYYVRPHPWDAVKWTPLRRVKSQWDLDGGLANHKGEDFLMVAAHTERAELLQAFAAVEPLGTVTASQGPGRRRAYSVFIARDFQGYPAVWR